MLFEMKLTTAIQQYLHRDTIQLVDSMLIINFCRRQVVMDVSLKITIDNFNQTAKLIFASWIIYGNFDSWCFTAYSILYS